MPDIDAATQAQEQTDAEIATAQVEISHHFNRETDESRRNALQAQIKVLAQKRADLRALELKRLLDEPLVAEALAILQQTNLSLQEEVRRLKVTIDAVSQATRIVAQVETAFRKLLPLLA